MAVQDEQEHHTSLYSDFYIYSEKAIPFQASLKYIVLLNLDFYKCYKYPTAALDDHQYLLMLCQDLMIAHQSPMVYLDYQGRMPL